MCILCVSKHLSYPRSMEQSDIDSEIAISFCCQVMHVNIPRLKERVPFEHPSEHLSKWRWSGLVNVMVTKVRSPGCRQRNTKRPWDRQVAPSTRPAIDVLKRWMGMQKRTEWTECSWQIVSVATQGCTNSEAASFWSLKNYSLSHDQKHITVWKIYTIVKHLIDKTKHTRWHKQQLFVAQVSGIMSDTPFLAFTASESLSLSLPCFYLGGLDIMDIISNMIFDINNRSKCIMNTVASSQSVHTILSTSKQRVCQTSSMLYRIK